MSIALKLRRGTTAQHASFTGAAGEVTIDTDKNVAVVHDGVTAGGHPLAPVDILQWLGKPIGEPFPLRDDITGVPIPPTNNAQFRFIKLTASDAYNTGALTSESVSGSAPNITATAVISLSSSPINGQTINLLNTEMRFIRPNSTGGALQDSANLVHNHGIVMVAGAGGGTGVVVSGTSAPQGTSGAYVAQDGDSEARPRNQGMTYYMRIK